MDAGACRPLRFTVAAEGRPGAIEVITLVVAALAVVVVGGVAASSSRLWLQARMAGAPVDYMRLLEMRLRKVNPGKVIDAYICATRESIDVRIDELEEHCLAGGSALAVVAALIAADRMNIALSFQQAAALDLIGTDIVGLMKSAKAATDRGALFSFDTVIERVATARKPEAAIQEAVAMSAGQNAG